MTMNPLPPQAYTKETLLKAYSWLQNQNSSIKEMATTPDILVSLYLKTTRDGDGALDRPSIQNFKNELKSLAGLMGEFEKSPGSEEKSGSSTEVESKRKEAAAGASYSSQENYSAHPPGGDRELRLPPMMGEKILSHWDCDSKSRFMIQEVKTLFNLSSEEEALRLLIKVGFERLQKL